MTTEQYLRGKIGRASTGDGAIGLLVEAWVLDDGVSCTISSTLTNDDGGYALPVSEKHSGQPIRIRIRDRDGNEIYERSRGLRIREGARNTINVDLEDDVLRFHDQRPTSFDRKAPGINDRPGAERDINEAIALIAPVGTQAFANMSRAGLCPGPFWELFEDLRIDSFDVIDGDPRAIERFRDGLRQLRASDIHLHRPEPIARQLPGGDVGIDRIGIGDRDLIGGRDIARDLDLIPDIGLIPDQVIETPRPPGQTISRDQSVPIMIATRLVGEPGDLDVVLGGLCDFEEMGWLRRQALEVLGGRDPGGLRGILGTRGGEWGPDDGPPRDFPPRCPPPVDEHIECAGEISSIISLIPPTYMITSVSPARACAGETIVISGSGFDSTPGVVRFRRRDSGARISVTPLSWTDTQIEVEVPAQATCGIDLRIPWRTVSACERFITLYRRPDIRADFEGTAADILKFTVNGSERALTCLLPGDTIDIRWEVCAADDLEVQLVDESGDVLASATSPLDSGLLRYTIPPGDRTLVLTASIRVTGDCDPSESQIQREVWIHRRPNLSITGMEISQAIQYYGANQHLTDPMDIGPDNSVQLVAGKTGWARVYLDSGQDPAWDSGRLPNVTGNMFVERRSGSSWTPLGTISAAPPGTTVAQANPGYAAERSDIRDTLNFQVPASWMSGRLRFTCSASSDSAPCGGGSATFEEIVDVDLRQTLRISGIFVGYNGPNQAGTGTLTLGAPTMAQLQATAALTIAMFPVADAVNFRSAGTLTQTAPLTDPLQAMGSNCSPNWDAFMTAVRAVVNADGNRPQEVYYGIMNAGIPVGPVVGCGGGGLGTGQVNQFGTMAHEVGHALGLGHAPCGNPPNPDPNYPAYEPYDPTGAPGALIGEYGLDNRDGSVRGPRTTDNMSYCGGWISLYSYGQLLNVARLNPTPVATARVSGAMAMASTDAYPIIDLLVSLDEIGAISGVAVCRVKSRPHDPGPVTELTAELLDRNSKVLASAPVTELYQDACGCGSGGGGGGSRRPRQLQATLSDVARGAALRIRHGDEELWRREAPATNPQVEIRSARVMRNGKLDLQWTADVGPDANADIWVRWAPAGSDDWRAVTVGLTGSRARLDLSTLPGGDVQFEVMVQDGFSCASATTVALSVPEPVPEVAIVSPTEGQPIDTARPIRLKALVARADGSPVVDPGEARWLLDNKLVGHDMELWLEGVAPGAYTLRFECAGAEVEQQIEVVAED